MQSALNQAADAFIAKYKNDILRDIVALCAVRSVEEPAKEGAPCGEGPRCALDVALAIAHRLGLATCDGDGYMGWAELPGQKKDYIATISHVDVVPEGNGWDADPYILREKEGWLLARGVIDDKGPLVLTLYLLKFFKEQGQPLPYTLRALIGCCEETGMQDVEHYLACNEEPVFAFTPDADFPLCNGEKGMFGGTLTSEVLNGNILAFSGGDATNAVPDKATCILKADAAALPPAERITLTNSGNGTVTLLAEGIGGHASTPAGTLNAIALLVNYILENQLAQKGSEERFLTLLQALHSSTAGEGLHIACSDGPFGALTLIGGTIAMEDGRLAQTLDIRYPTTTSGDALGRRFNALAAEYGAQFTPTRDMVPFYIEPTSQPIQALMDAYKTVTGNWDAQPFTIGGGTYARHFKHAVSFGILDSRINYPAFAGCMHAANEGVEAEQLMRALKIYILACAKLQTLQL